MNKELEEAIKKIKEYYADGEFSLKALKPLDTVLNYVENSIPKEKVKAILDKLDEKYEDRTENLESILEEQHFLFNSKDYYEGEITGLQEVKIMLIDLNKELLEEK